jgi:virginiamycin B lyase
MYLHAHKLISSLLAFMIFMFMFSACEGQRASVTPLTNTSLPAQSPVSTTLHLLRTPVPSILTDAASMHIGRVIPIGNDFPFGLAFARHNLWVLMRRASFLPPGSILRIDPSSGQVVGEPIQVDFDPWSFAVTEDAIWVAKNGPQKLVRIDPSTGQVVATVAVNVSLVAADTLGAWIDNADQDDNTVLHIDPSTNNVVGNPISVGLEPIQIAAGAGAIWVGSHSGPPPVTRIDPATGKVVATIEVGFPVHGLAAGPDSVWVVDYHGQKVVRISPQTNQVVDDLIPIPFPPFAVAASATDAWVGVSAMGDNADSYDDRVVRIDLRTNTIVDTIHVGGPVIAMLFADGSLWIATERPSLIVQVVPRPLGTPTPYK